MLDAKVLKYLNLNWLKSPTPMVDGRVIMWWEQTDHHHDQVNQFLWCLLHLVALAAYKDHEFYVFCWLKDFPSLLTCLICWTVAMANKIVRWSFKGHSVPELLRIESLRERVPVGHGGLFGNFSWAIFYHFIPRRPAGDKESFCKLESLKESGDVCLWSPLIYEPYCVERSVSDAFDMCFLFFVRSACFELPPRSICSSKSIQIHHVYFKHLLQHHQRRICDWRRHGHWKGVNVERHLFWGLDSS